MKGEMETAATKNCARADCGLSASTPPSRTRKKRATPEEKLAKLNCEIRKIKKHKQRLKIREAWAKRKQAKKRLAIWGKAAVKLFAQTPKLERELLAEMNEKERAFVREFGA